MKGYSIAIRNRQPVDLRNAADPGHSLILNPITQDNRLCSEKGINYIGRQGRLDELQPGTRIEPASRTGCSGLESCLVMKVCDFGIMGCPKYIKKEGKRFLNQE